ncbi:MAG TPA: dynamin family protein [Polyangiaceae bacterium]|nr:dynamin family protein [Polyangiaceae bacterium]
MATVGDETAGLNENHRRALGVTFQHIDELLSNALFEVTSGSPFSHVRCDLEEPELRAVSDHIARVRELLASAYTDLGIPRRAPHVLGSAALDTAALFAMTDLEEMSPARLAGYGSLGSEAAERVAQVEAALNRALEELRTYVLRRTTWDLAGRFERLGSSIPAPDLLHAVERLIRERGLVEFRPALESVLERLESPRFEIAVFGRVSSGKSSLLNAILGSAVLPIGVTPVTAVPTRVVWGSERHISIEFANSEPIRGDLDRLAEYVTEAQNPDNSKNVTRVTVFLDAECLRGGVVLADTPGVGSLATTGARLTYSYLPRCDHGVVILDPAGALSRDDVRLVRLLLEGGIRASVVIGKADLLTPESRSTVVQFARETLQRELGVSIDVEPVSALADAGAPARAWYEAHIAPLARQAAQSSEAIVGRKLRALAENLLAALRAAGGGPSDAPSTLATGAILVDAERAHREAEDAAYAIGASAAELLSEVISRAARELATMESSDAQAASIVSSAADVVSSDARRRSVAILERFARQLDVLRARRGQSSRSEPLPTQRASVEVVTQPLLLMPDLASLRAGPSLIPKAFSGLRAHRLERELRAGASNLESAFGTFVHDLANWTITQAKQILSAFSADVQPSQPSLRGAEGARNVSSDVELLERLLALHTSKPPGPAETA